MGWGAASQRDEPTLWSALDDSATPAASISCQLLGIAVSHWGDDGSLGRHLGHPFRKDAPRSAGDQYPLVRGGRRPTVAPITFMDLDPAPLAELGQPFPCRSDETGIELDPVDGAALSNEFRDQCGQIPRTNSDLQHLQSGPKLRPFEL